MEDGEGERSRISILAHPAPSPRSTSHPNPKRDCSYKRPLNV
jgi:hypothetical protein